MKNLSEKVFCHIRSNPGCTKADMLKAIPGLTTHSIDYRLTVMVELSILRRARDNQKGRYKYWLDLPQDEPK